MEQIDEKKNINNNKDKDEIIKKEEYTQSIDKLIIHRSPFLSKTYFQNNKTTKVQSPSKDIKKIKKESRFNFKRQLSQINTTKNKSYLSESKFFPDISSQDKTCSNISNNTINKKVNFNMVGNKKQFYITSSYVPLSQKRTLKNSRSMQNIKKKNNDYIIDLIHEKEIKLCLDLIKAIPGNKNDINKRIDIDKDFSNKQANDIIKILKTFNYDNIANQRLLEEQILNEYNNNKNNNIPEINNQALGTLSISMSTNYRTNNLKPLNSIYKFNLSKITNNRNSSITLKNNNSSFNKYLDESNNTSINEKLNKSKLMKSTNNKFNIVKSGNLPGNEINFHTGFVRNQKNIYDDIYLKYFKNSKKNEMRVKRFRKKKLEANKLSLPEIEEYKSIVKDIENRRNKVLKKSKSMLDINKDKNDILMKDKLMELLNNIYKDQRNSFLSSLKNSIFDSEKMKINSYKNEINENIKNINKNKRLPNTFVDGYSLFEGKINQKLLQYNYILGNRFHNKEQKLEKAKKFINISNEFENKIKYYKKVLLDERCRYESIFKPKINFDKDKNVTPEDIQIDIDQYFNNNDIINVAMRNRNKKKYTIDKNSFKNLSINKTNRNKIYDDYTQFKNECKQIYSLD